jgi:hypothetical protein
MIAELFHALDDGDTAPLRDVLVRYGVDVEQVRQLPQWNVESPPDILDDALRAAAAHPSGVALVLLYLLLECEECWEVSYHYEPIWRALREGRARWRAHAETLDRSEAAMAEGTAMLLAIVDAEIQVENAMTSGRLGGFAEAAEKVVEEARRALMQVPVMRPFCRPLADEVTKRADAAEAYYQACAAAGHGLRQFFAAPGSSLDDAIAALTRAEASDVGIPTTRKGELRAHRFALQNLRDQAGSRWLHVDQGKVVYIYPFAVRGASAGHVVARAAAEASGWSLAEVSPSAVHPSFVADDVWDGSDLFGRRYDGTQIDLPPVQVHDLGGKHLSTLDAQLMLSVIGNHYVRLEGELLDANPQDVFAAMFRGAREHGTATVSVAGATRTWPRLSDLAQDLAVAVGQRLELPVSERRGMFHVMVVVNAASLGAGPVGPRTEVRNGEDMVSATGTQVLTNPVTNCIGSLVEWIRYPMPSRTNILGSVTMRDDIVVRTVNTTVLVGLGSPSFHIGTRETVAEFVASLEGLFAGWSDDLRAHYAGVQELLDRTQQVDGGGSDAVRESIDELKRAQRALEEFVADTRSAVALIESPALVASPVVSAMKAGLLEAADFRSRAAELDRQVEEVLGSRLALRIEEALRRLDDRMVREELARQARQRRWLDVALGVIAAIGVSGIGQIIQAGYDVHANGALVITAAIVALAILVGVLVRRVNAPPPVERARQSVERRAAKAWRKAKANTKKANADKANADNDNKRDDSKRGGNKPDGDDKAGHGGEVVPAPRVPVGEGAQAQ